MPKPSPVPIPGLARVSGNARPGMPGRTGRSGAGSCPDNPRAQSPRPVWVRDGGLFFVPPYKEGEVRMCEGIPVSPHIPHPSASTAFLTPPLCVLGPGVLHGLISYTWALFWYGSGAGWGLVGASRSKDSPFSGKLLGFSTLQIGAPWREVS